MNTPDFATFAAITELKSRYCRLVDKKLWDEWRKCLTDDASGSFGSTELSSGSGDAIVAMIKAHLTGKTTVHHCLNPEITQTGPDTAAAIWGVHGLIISAETRGEGFAWYHETYRREKGIWKIATLRVESLTGFAVPL
ncbi:MAG: nuclear transport factor 2 family protein [Spongiibacteraceae bacterium]